MAPGARARVHINIRECVGGCYVRVPAAPRMCGVQHECTGAFFFFLHNGEFAELISANSAASPAVLGVGVHIHEAPVSPAGASCCSAPGPTQRRSRSAHATEVTQCYVAGSRRGVTSRGGGVRPSGSGHRFTCYRINITFSACVYYICFT